MSQPPGLLPYSRHSARTHDIQAQLSSLVNVMMEDALSSRTLDPVAKQASIARLERKLRAERARGQAAHCSYNLVQHAALVLALRQLHKT